MTRQTTTCRSTSETFPPVLPFPRRRPSTDCCLWEGDGREGHCLSFAHRLMYLADCLWLRHCRFPAWWFIILTLPGEPSAFRTALPLQQTLQYDRREGTGRFDKCRRASLPPAGFLHSLVSNALWGIIWPNLLSEMSGDKYKVGRCPMPFVVFPLPRCLLTALDAAFCCLSTAFVHCRVTAVDTALSLPFIDRPLPLSFALSLPCPLPCHCFHCPFSAVP